MKNLFDSKVLNEALSKAMKGNVADVSMIFSLLDGYVAGRISETDLLNDIKVLMKKK